MTIQTSLGRRSFLVKTAAVVGGLSLGFRIPADDDAAEAAEIKEINAWVVIHPDDKVVIRIARSEMGQGTLTGLAQLVAEELECDWSKVTTEFPTPGENLKRKRVWGEMGTGGSRGIRTSHQYVREGGAAAREMLIAAAAAEWKVPASECTAANSVVTHTASGRKLGYGQLAMAAAKLDPPNAVKLKDPKDWKLIGKPLKRLDTLDKLTGKQVYGIDMRLPGMLIATIKACPVHGGKLKSFDAAKVEKMPGVKKVVPVDGNAVAVVADTYWNAHTALAALPVEWDAGKLGQVQQDDVTAMLKEGLDANEAFIGNKAGDAKATIAGAAKKVEATYKFPWQAHACMEPMNATALYTPEKCEVWCGTQNGEAALAAAAEAAELPVSKCEAYKLILGGGFGRRGRADYVRQAVLIAKQMPGTPVKMIWSREEDMTQDSYHPTTMCKMTAGLDAENKLVGLHVRISGQSILAALSPQSLENGMDSRVFQGFMPGGPEAAYGYTVPNLLIDHAMRNPHVTPGFWRGVNTNQNAIYMECFMDEVAEAAGQDPLDFRLKMLKPKYAAVLKATADKAGYGKKLPDGHFHGLAQIMGYGSYVAGIAEISVSNDGVLKVHKITAGTDPGYGVNPWLIDRQVAGSFVYGLSASLYGEITIKDGAVEQTNFDSYNVMRMDEMPEVETVLVPSGGFWGGVGEPTIAVAAPAVLNGIYKATGKRIRELPLMNHDLRKGA
ncbi:isoquinoline 1-oxidoreductase, beta subunit [Enhydrobacter aerosaccus]|uniref:Isoquinoline 1-oxidoreductase, beta subunit n=1 Tax=Enhydrobacter aerosaccus TaxID=225324 RepID=A0A1T4R5D3_9HYPH|nr:molybdopterin cofactor-binding domain-containing protein [Enhydrobacter aerosaccus]SKA11163.1 isoquinoline 1-oxidoreductase, beta subunit [Enhydrobacter aerosaccus]